MTTTPHPPHVDEFLLTIVRNLKRLASRSETNTLKRGRLHLACSNDALPDPMQAAKNNLNREAA